MTGLMATANDAPPAAPQEPRSTALLLLQMFVILLAVLPARLVIGPVGSFGSPASVVGILAFGLWAFSSLEPGLLARRVVPLRVGLVLLWIPGLVSYGVMHLTARDGDEVNAADRWILFMLVWTGVALLAAEALRNREDVLRLLRLVVAGAAFSSFVAILQARLSIDLTTRLARIPGLSVAGELDSVLKRNGLARPAGTATHPIEFGCVLAMALGPALVLASYDHGWPRLRRYSAVAIIGLGIPLAVSRSAILSAGIVGVVWFIAADAAQRIRGAVAAMLFMVVIFLTSPGLLGTLRQYFQNVGSDDSISTRTDDYAAVTKYIRQSPLIGRGPATFLPKYRILDNQWLAQLIETGILGTLALLGFFLLPLLYGAAIRRVNRLRIDRQLGQAFIGVSLVAMFASGTFDAFSFPTMPGFFSVYVGLAAALLAIGRAERTHAAPIDLPLSG